MNPSTTLINPTDKDVRHLLTRPLEETHPDKKKFLLCKPYHELKEYQIELVEHYFKEYEESLSHILKEINDVGIVLREKLKSDNNNK